METSNIEQPTSNIQCPAAGSPAKARELPSLNGWRAVSILLVLGAHVSITAGVPARCGYWAGRAFDGVLGVRCFFTISGLLITWLMLQEEKESGGVSLKKFYARRALRILPAYFACLAVLAVAQAAGIVEQSGRVWFQLFSFTRNFHQSAHLDPAFSGHFWSLAVEEQFYLVWPLVFLWLARSTGKRIGFLVLMVVLSTIFKVVAVLGSHNRHLYFLFQENSTFIVLDCLAYGCLGAVLMDLQPEAVKNFFARRAVPVFVLGGLLLLIPAIAGLGLGMQSLGLILLLMQSVLLPEFKPVRFLSHPWLVRIGVLSYSLYIWQQLVYVLWPFPKLWFLAFPATFVAGWLSYKFLEKPFLVLRSKFRSRAHV